MSTSGTDFGTLYTSLVSQAVGEGRSADIQGVIGLVKGRVATRPQFDAESHREIGRLMNGLGNALIVKGDLDNAMPALDEAERIFRDLSEKSLLATCLESKALALRQLANVDGAVAAYTELAKLCREAQDTEGLERALSNHANLLLDIGDTHRAAPLIKEQEALGKSGGDKLAEARALGQQAKTHFMAGDAPKALALHEEQELLCREFGDKHAIAEAVGNRALMLIALNRLDEARPLVEEKERLCREIDDKPGLANALGSLALIFQARGDPASLTRALALHHESASISREVGDHGGLAKGLAMQAQILTQIGRAQEGVPLAEEAHQVAMSHGQQHLAQQMVKPILDYVRAGAAGGPPASGVASAQSREGLKSTQHLGEAMRYEQEMMRWLHLPFWKRLVTRKPQAP